MAYLEHKSTYRPPSALGGGYVSHLPLPFGPGGAPPAFNPDLDELLEQIADTLQLTRTQLERATSAYGSITDWLAADGSPLARFRPRLFPQGSAALLTTTKPVGRNDYDVDVVCQLLVTGWTPMQLYEAVWNRLAMHGVYRPMMEPKNRCIRINYEAEFHLDIVPGEPAPRSGVRHGERALRIPDRRTSDWTPANPQGYVLWFHEQAETARLLKAARDVAPLPTRLTEAQNTVLATVVQLVKRRRDLRFAAPDRAALAPRSILITTLAALVYDGEQSTGRALHTVVTGMANMVRAAWPNRIVVVNPTNPEEQFCDQFTPETYQAFVEFVLELEAEVVALTHVKGGLPQYQQQLDTLFGSEPVQKAFVAYGNRRRAAASEGRLHASSAAGLAVVSAASRTAAAPSGRQVPGHRFFGASPAGPTTGEQEP
jgi:hypothetical protein